MALRISTGQPIPLARRSNFIKVLEAVPLIEQEESNWCWAAAADMVLDFYGQRNVRQCDLAKELFSRRDCCGAASSDFDKCNKGAEAEDLSPLFAARNVKSKLKKASVTFVKLTTEIDRDQPVQVAFRWEGSDGGHVVIIKGYGRDLRDGTELLAINDPWPPFESELNGQVEYDSLLDAYGRGALSKKKA